MRLDLPRPYPLDAATAERLGIILGRIVLRQALAELDSDSALQCNAEHEEDEAANDNDPAANENAQDGADHLPLPAGTPGSPGADGLG